MASVRCTAQEIDIKPSCLQMLEGHRPSVRARREGLRHRVRERAGGRAHQPPVPARQLQRRLRRRHRRPERARARLVHLRRRRPHVALQRQCQRPEDADQAPRALGRGERLGRARRRSGARRDPGDDHQPGARPRRRGCHKRGRSPTRAARRASARTSCRTSTSTRSCATATRRPRSRSWRGRRGTTRARARGPTHPTSQRNAYALAEIKKHLRTFCWRFFKTSQFKRSAAPNAPKVGSGGSLSPRGDWRAPSDSEATVWLEDVDRIPDA